MVHTMMPIARSIALTMSAVLTLAYMGLALGLRPEEKETQFYQQMDSNMDNKFYVVEFIDPPTKDFEKYVCIPDTWAFVTNDDLVLIKYPLEKSSITKQRVKKREMYSDDWMVFEANIQFSTEVYRDANNYIKVQKNILIQERSYAEVVDEECQPSTSGSSSYESEQNTSTAEINEPTTGPPLNHAESDQPTLTDTNLAIQKKPTEVNKTANSANQGKTYLTRQALRLTELQKHESLLPTHTDSKDQRKYYVTEDSEEEYNDFIESEDSEAYVNDESTDMSESDESASSSIDNVSEGTKEPNDKVRHPLFQAEFIGLIKQLHSCLKQNSEKSKFLRPVYTIQSSMIECVLKSIENFNTSGDNKTLGVVTAGVNEIKIGGQIENIMVADSVQEAQAEEADKNLQKNKVDEDNTNKNTTPIPRGRLRKFTLPPEYDENDSRWTLRYRKKDKNLRELIPHSEIYVNKISLSTCKRLSKDSKTLARMLLLEIFTKNALSVCSLTGKKANAYNTEAIRPGLDKNARIVLLNYVEQHAQENKWVKLDTQSILNTLRNKMQDMRIQDGELFVLATRRKNKNKNNNDLL